MIDVLHTCRIYFPYLKLHFQLQAKLFGVPVVPWVIHAAVTVLCFVLIMVIRMDIYNPFPNI